MVSGIKWFEELIGTPKVLDDGTEVVRRAVLDFIGDGVTVTDDPVNGKTKITIAGGGEPGGSDGQPQWNDNGALAGMSTAVWNAVKKSLSIGTGGSATGDESHNFGYNSIVSGTYASNMGPNNVISGVAATGHGENLQISGTNGNGNGFQVTISGDYASGEGAYLSGAGDCSRVEGVLASAPLNGQYAHNGGLAYMQDKCIVAPFKELNAAPGVLELYGGEAVILQPNTSYVFDLRMQAASTDGTKHATEERRVHVKTDGSAATIVFNDPVWASSDGGTPANGFSDHGWSYTVTAEAGRELRITCDPNTDKVRFMGRWQWTEIYALTDTPSVFDPATLTLNGWWRASYAGSPWAGTASNGTSGSNAASEGTNPPAVSGTPLNGLDPADFDGTNDILGPSGTLGDYVTAGAGSGWALVWIDAIGSDAGNFSNEAILSALSGGYYAIEVKATGSLVRHVIWDGAGDKVAERAITTGAWNLVTWRHDGTDIEIGVNEAPGAAGGASTATCGNIGSGGTSQAVAIGKNYNAAEFLNGKIAEIGLAPSALSDGDFANVISYINSRYGLSL